MTLFLNTLCIQLHYTNECDNIKIDLRIYYLRRHPHTLPSKGEKLNCIKIILRNISQILQVIYLLIKLSNSAVEF